MHVRTIAALCKFYSNIKSDYFICVSNITSLIREVSFTSRELLSFTGERFVRRAVVNAAG